MQQEIILILILTTISCALTGSFLVLRKMSMITDAISHTVLLGIIIAYFVTRDLNSPLLFILATLFGLITVWLVELIVKTKRVKEDASIGIIFPLFFSLSIILITKYAHHVHIDKDVVLLGQLVLTPLSRVTLFGYSFPVALVSSTLITIINVIFIIIFYKELKITSFDKEYSKLIGISNTLISFLLMSLVSSTAVMSFDIVGAILVISLMIVPASSAYLITKKLVMMIVLTLLFAVSGSLIGYAIAYYFDISVTGVISVVNGIIFIVVMLLNAESSVIYKYGLKKFKKKKFEQQLILIHIYNHEKDFEELGVETINLHLNWPRKKLEKHILDLTKNEMLYKNNTMYHLTTKGKKYITKVLNK